MISRTEWLLITTAICSLIFAGGKDILKYLSKEMFSILTIMDTSRVNDIAFISFLWVVFVGCFPTHPTLADWKKVQCGCDSSKKMLGGGGITFEFEHFDKKDFERERKKISVVLKDSLGHIISKQTDTVNLVTEG